MIKRGGLLVKEEVGKILLSMAYVQCLKSR